MDPQGEANLMKKKNVAHLKNKFPRPALADLPHVVEAIVESLPALKDLYN